MDPTYVSNLETLLGQTMAPDTQLIATATKTLKDNVYSRPQSLPALIHILQQNANVQIKQLAAVEARKLAPIFWGDLPEDLKAQVRQSLLQSTLAEQSALVRHASARVISSIAKTDMPAGAWNDLPAFLSQAATSQKASDREVGVYILYTLFETIESIFTERMGDLFALFGRTIQDPESLEVRSTTLLAMGKVSEILDGEDKHSVKMFREILPSMVNVLQEVIQAGDEAAARNAFEVFNTLLILDPQLIAKHVADLVNFMVQLAQSKEIDETFRCMALSFIMTCVRFKRSKLQKLNLGPALTLALLQICTEEDSPTPEDDCPSRLAFRTIDQLATSLPPSAVMAPLMNAIPQYFNNADPGHRKAALTAVAVAVEGSVDFVSNQLDVILPLVKQGLADSENVVRRAGLLLLGQLAEELPDIISAQHSDFIPLVFAIMATSGEDVATSACNALDALLEGLKKDDIVGYLPRLMERLCAVLQSGAATSVKLTVAAAIGSAAHAAEDEFVPYFEMTMKSLEPYLGLKSEDSEEMDLRGVVTDTIGSVAGAVGKERFGPFADIVVKLAHEGMNIGNPRVRECSFCFFAIMARVYGADFAPFLEYIVPDLIKSCEQEEHEDLVGEDGTINLGGEDDDDEDGLGNLGVNSAIAMEKEIAGDAMGEIFAHTKHAFMPYFEKCTEALMGLTTHFYEGVRKAAFGSLWRFVSTLNVMMSQGQPEWTPGIAAANSMHPDVAKIATMVRNLTLQEWEDEDEKMVVTEICRNIADCVRTAGPGVLGNDLERIATATLKILNKQHTCQIDNDYEDGVLDNDEDGPLGDDEDTAEYDQLLVDSAFDIVIALSYALGEEFQSAFGTFLPSMLKYYDAKRSNAERAMTVAGVGECAGGLKAGITPYTAPMFKLFNAGLEDPDAEVRSNSAYAVGLLVYSSNEDLSSQYMSVLKKLQPFFEGENHRNGKDNAIGCVARMIMKNAAAVPLPQVLPHLVANLPLENDFQENTPVYNMIIQLYRTNDAIVMGLTGQLLPVLASVLAKADEQLKPKVKEELVELVRALNGQYAAQISQHPALVAVLA
ncbi:putative importin subunit beta-4 [Saitoella complicata NRRL Y-17804]|uniref:putative importin subunit beta-4 n=1 Tax=Saitoella complicata (strain BCRC 22490 / CBS 7301 / JCM 7358 / NBRC 10748 / NRRL Y-17804) TaxID=698492 RepID=UPI00086790B1|nr:putative importin subunit beta-4 [Saitoella complicata NRRL Y-17804]ODQ55945.1 putative importin subunit beta-4 [Saitoella complicata NRRL Y-17804]